MIPDRPDDDSLGAVFWSVARRMRHLTRQAVDPLGVTPGQARALAVLRRHGGMRPGELSEHLRIVPRSTTEVIDGLQERGLVERSPDPDDRRAVRVTLTPAGAELAATAAAAQAREAEAFFGRLSEADRQTLARILGSLRNG